MRSDDHRPPNMARSGMLVHVTAVRSVVLVGLFSAKDRDHQERLDALEARVMALGDGSWTVSRNAGASPTAASG
ncbi:hypothetical protein GCM10027614_13460 [Micromonospora vulcania]